MTEDNKSDKETEALRKLGRELQIVVHDSSTLLQSLHAPRERPKHFTLAYDQSTAKHYFFTQCLLKVQTMVGAQIRLFNYMESEVARRQRKEKSHAVVTASLVAEFSLWRRQLAEVLARLILFSDTNSDKHFYHYLLIHEAEEAAYEVEHISKDFGATSATLARRADDLRQRAKALNLGPPLWYAQEKKKDLVSATATSVIREAMKKATPMEAGALGHSYLHGFSGPSRVLHFSTVRDRKSDIEEFHFASRSLFLLATAITARIGDFTGLPTSYSLDRKPAVAPPQGSPFSVGDFVVVILDDESLFLSEVLSASPTTPPIGRVRVRFLDAPPYTDIPEDEFSSDFIQLFMAPGDLHQELMARAAEVNPTPDQVRDAMRKTVLELWNIAMRDRWRDGLQKAILRGEKGDIYGKADP